MQKRKLSVVVTTRNDNFGKDMLHRLRLFLDTIVDQAERFGVDAELLVVEWNPPKGETLVDVALPDRGPSPVPIRFIQVPPELHETLDRSGAIPLFQMIAKNVGIRRAHSDFVLCTNQDILLSDETMRYFAEQELDPNALYRIERTDVEAEVPIGLSSPERIAWCRDHVIRVNASRGTLIALDYGRRHGWAEWRKEVRKGSSLTEQIKRHALRPFETPRRGSVFTNACGDFTLCSKTLWEKAGGYMEIPIYSLHIDSLFCYAAVGAGAKEVVLEAPCETFHLEHHNSWAMMDARHKLEWFKTKPWVDWTVVTDVASYMLKNGPILLNDEDWGFAGIDLEEHIFLEGEVERIEAQT